MSSDLITSLRVAVGGVALAILLGPRVRSWRRRLDGPDGFDCGWRVVHGHVPGLASRWRQGQTHVQDGRLVWRRLPWWWQQARPVTATVEPVVHRQRGIFDAIWRLAPTAVIVPVVLRSGERLEMAVLPNDLDHAVAQLRRLTQP